MSADGFSWHAPVAPLLALGSRLGIEADDWGRAEELERLSGARLAPIPLRSLRGAVAELAALPAVYGPALGELSLRLDVSEPETEAQYPEPDYRRRLDLVAADLPEADLAAVVEEFLDQFHYPDEDRFFLGLELDKPKLVEAELGRFEGGAATLFLHVGSFADHFRDLAGLRQVQGWWPAGDPRPRIVLLPGWRPDRPPEQRLLLGPYLTLIGGEPVESGLWQRALQEARGAGATVPASEAGEEDVCAPQPVSPATLLALWRQDRWRPEWAETLTPLHLDTRGGVPADDELATLLRWWFAALVALYTADSAHADDDGWVATYEGVEGCVEVRLEPPPQRLEAAEVAGLTALGELARWIYGGRSPRDRLALVQNAVCRDLRGEEPGRALRRLMARAPRLLEQVEHGWKAFVEDKVDAFFEVAQVLEDHVESAAREFVDHTDGMIRKLSETMLAAVAVVLGALALPLVRDGEVDYRVLWWGFLVYGLYVLVLPLGYSMTLRWQEHRDARRRFDERYARIERRLPARWESEVGRDPVRRSVRRFQVWFAITLATYLLLLAVLGAGLILVGWLALTG